MASCQHCGLPTPSESDTFCCGGCQIAHQLIHQCGLEDYYQLRQTDDETQSPERRNAVSYEDFDREDVIERYVKTTPDGRRTIKLGLAGMHCAACIWLLERLPRLTPGVVDATVQWQRSTIEITWIPETVGLSRIAQTLEHLGYRPHLLNENAAQSVHQLEDRRRLIALAMAGAAAGNAMLVAIALYLGDAYGMTANVQTLLRIVSCVLGLFALSVPGRTFFVGAWAALRSRTPHMDLPVALGLLVGGVAGTLNTVRGTGEIYFDTMSALVFLLLVGRWIQHRQQHNAAEAVDILQRLTPRIAHKYDDTGARDVPVEVLVPGDVVDVLPGEAVPADGVVVSGESSLDQAILTGETVPSPVGPSHSVAAGTINLVAPLRIEVHAVGEDTRMGRILAWVQHAGPRPAIVQLADRVGRVFVTSVIAIAALTLTAWLIVEPAVAVDRTVALLIVACPCALALATPLAVAVALGRASQRQILIKGGDALQRLSTPGILWLDKTGTLTEGRMKMVEWQGDEALQPYVAALEAYSTHPIATAFRNLASDNEYSVQGIVRENRGLTGVVAGRRLHIGNEIYLRDQDVELDSAHLAQGHAMLERGLSPVYIAVDQSLAAVAGIGDPVRPDAAAAVAGLQRRGWTVGILSGDHPEVVTRVAAKVRIDPKRAHGGLLPEDKVSYVTAAEHTVMVGDGLNDSAALSAAAVGIATHNGAEASLMAASVYAGQPGLSVILELIEGSKSTMRTIRRNFGVSLAYNAISVSLAATGWISPWLAAILMPISSISVVASSLALRWAPSKVFS